MSFRKEKKYRLSVNEFFLIKKTLISKGMIKLYDTRKVNSIYFDNFSYDMFNQSEEGVVPRKKVRIRWYENKNNFTLEKKISGIEGRFKTTKVLMNFTNVNDLLKTNFFDKDYVRNLLKELQLQLFQNCL